MVHERRKHVSSFLEGLPGFIYLRGSDGRIRFANRCFRERFGDPGDTSCPEFLQSDGTRCADCGMAALSERRLPCALEKVLSDGRAYRIYGYPYEDAGGAPLILVFGLEVTASRHEGQALLARARQQAAVAELGQWALAGVDLSVLMTVAAAMVARVLGVEYSQILEFLPAGSILALRAGAGWREGVVGRAFLKADCTSPAGYALLINEPVLFEDLPADSQFPGPSLLHDYGIVSGVSVVIAGKDISFGVLGACAASRRRFTRDDVHFLQSVANVLAAAMERKRSEEALKESEERFRTLVEHSLVGFFIVREGTIVFMNPEQRRIFGACPGAFELRAFEDIHPDDAGKFAQLCETMARGDGGLQEMDIRFFPFPFGAKSSGKGMRWAHCRVSPILYRDGKAALVTMIDITRAKEMEHRALVQEKMASLGHVAAGIAHEIRNPLSGINIYLDSLGKLLEESEGLEPENKEMARVIGDLMRSASGKIEGVIRRVMDFAKPNPPRLDLCDINRCIAEASHMTSVTLRKAGVKVRKILHPELPHCPADPRLIEQVLMNLLANAGQAMEAMEGPRLIEIASSVDGGHVVVTVSDSGPGVPPHIADRIFDPFYTTRKDGSGIGLSFSHRVATDHGGFLSVDRSRLGGAEFRLGLPLKNSNATT